FKDDDDVCFQHGAFVLLYHPCSSLRERRLLSGLARSCLPFHIVTPHPQLSRDTPVALVSWGRTLELSTLASSDVCDWLQTTQSLKNVDGRTPSAVYNLLLTRSAGLQRLEPSEGTEVRTSGEISVNSFKNDEKMNLKKISFSCCQRVISALLSGTTGAEPAMKPGSWKRFKEGRKNREIRAAIGEKQNLINRANETANDADQIDRIGAAEAAAAAQNHSGSSGTASHSLPGLSDPNRTPPSEVRKQQASTSAPTSRPGSEIDSPQHEGTDSVRGGVEERSDTERDPAPGGEPPPHRNTKSGSASESQAETRQNCSACVRSGAGSRAAALNVALQRTPRTDEAVWAAAALGFLLVLLTLSVLHTRLYRHWRTSPSLYWHNPHQDYDSEHEGEKERRSRWKKGPSVLTHLALLAGQTSRVVLHNGGHKIKTSH
uniref:Tumor protein p53 inducible protein 13 n=1 Tax=Cyprinodon variegatus TaxID=28743 RepID=A0A3Q2DGQ1_CYPVA